MQIYTACTFAAFAAATAAYQKGTGSRQAARRLQGTHAAPVHAEHPGGRCSRLRRSITPRQSPLRAACSRADIIQEHALMSAAMPALVEQRAQQRRAAHSTLWLRQYKRVRQQRTQQRGGARHRQVVVQLVERRAAHPAPWLMPARARQRAARPAARRCPAPTGCRPASGAQGCEPYPRAHASTSASASSAPSSAAVPGTDRLSSSQ